jgi:hypothetical protein
MVVILPQNESRAEENITEIEILKKCGISEKKNTISIDLCQLVQHFPQAASSKGIEIRMVNRPAGA